MRARSRDHDDARVHQGAAVSADVEDVLARDDEQRYGQRALLLDGCECAAGADGLPEHSSVSSRAGVRSAAAKTTASLRKRGCARG
jgi:hypothetical protein